jgi:hypothetical protein
LKLNWADSARATAYDVYVDGVQVANGLTASEWTVSRHLIHSLHTWYVVARNACGSTTGPQWSFALRGSGGDDDDEVDHNQ